MHNGRARSNVPLIHFSTDYVFDGSGNKPWREDSPIGPISVYGASKLAGDTAIIAANGPHLIFRTSWVYAAKGVNFLRTIARLAKERAELKIVADQIGAPTSATAIANAVIAILRNNIAHLDVLFAKRRRRQPKLRGRNQLARFRKRSREWNRVVSNLPSKIFFRYQRLSLRSKGELRVPGLPLGKQVRRIDGKSDHWMRCQSSEDDVGTVNGGICSDPRAIEH